MCGIIGCVSTKNVVPILVGGLKDMEYRGYDSAGLVCMGSETQYVRTLGKVRELEKELEVEQVNGTSGIAHTRWATHGIPSERNAHPHTDCTGRYFVVHNGIIENYKELKDELRSLGHNFTSDTDTEVIAHLLEEYSRKGVSLSQAFQDTLSRIRGAYGLVVMDAQNPTTLLASRVSSPLIVGIGKNTMYIASDQSALLSYTKRFVYIGDNELVELSHGHISLRSLQGEVLPYREITVDYSMESAQKGAYAHFMLKEIMEAVDVVKNTTRGRIKKDGSVTLGGLKDVETKIRNASRIYLIACGTSYYSALVGEYYLEELANKPVEVCIASEFRYRTMPLEPDAIVIALSQSGETADTLAALRKTKEAGVCTLGIVNVVGSLIARETDAGVYNHVGPEIGVASTKAYVSQVLVLLLLASLIADSDESRKLIQEVYTLEEKIHSILSKRSHYTSLAKKYGYAQSMLYIGRRLMHPTALEGALKMKEITYIHAEGYSAGEMKHGPLALIDEKFPSVVLALHNSSYEKTVSNIQELKARGGPVIAIVSEGDTIVKEIADECLEVPATHELLEPLLAVIPLQLFAYEVGVAKGYDVDKPRNLAKSVTVE